MNHLSEPLNRIDKPRLLVLGDLMLDRYTWGSAQRVSPEAPVLVLSADREEVRLGGAASVAALLRGLDAEVILAGVIGDDPAGRTIRRLLDEAGIDGRLVAVDPDRPTTTKERFIGRAANKHAHQILRVDRESCATLGAEQERELAAAIVAELPNCQALLISDYAKGVCIPELLQTVIRAATDSHVLQVGNSLRGIPVLVDPARGADYARYRGASLIKPNRVEASQVWRADIVTPEEALAAGKFLCREFNLGAAVVTLDQEGMALAVPGSAGVVFPTKARSVYDITGAGDMALATLGICQAAGLELGLSVELANVASGLQVERLGVEPIRREEILAALAPAVGNALCGVPCPDVGNALRGVPFEADDPTMISPSPRYSGERVGVRGSEESPTGESNATNPPRVLANGGYETPSPRYSEDRSPESKLVSPSNLANLAANLRRAGRTIVFTNGCFDLLHVGHVTYLQEAAALGDVLVVGVNSDASVRRLKGPSRPIIGEADRAAMLAALACVGHVVIFDDDTPHALLHSLRPDVLVKGGTYTPAEVVGREMVETYGGKACVVGRLDGVSTTGILTNLLETTR